MEAIDLVYLWVNGNDPAWRAKRDACIGKTNASDENCEGRYADNDELKFSLRSVAKYAPWIRQIFIVTDNQIPSWINLSNPKIRIVDHKEILPSECLPCFNSVVIEHHLHNIDGLAERFIYANDDMLFNRPVVPGTFFAPDGLPIVRLNRRPLRKLTLWLKQHVLRKPLTSYLKTIHNAARLVEKRYGHYYGGKTHHNIDAYLRSDYKHAREVFAREIDATLKNHVRADNDVQRNLYSYVPLAEKRAHLSYVTQSTSFRFHIDNPKLYAKFEKSNPTFFCMNDTHFATNYDRRRAAEFLQRMFPEKSEFEKP